MSLRLFLPALLLMIAAALLTSYIFQRQISGGLINVALNPEMQDLLTTYRDDLRTLSRLDAEQRDSYRARFDAVQEQLEYYAVLELNREQLEDRFQAILTGLLIVIMLGAATLYWWQHRNTERRLTLLQGHLEALSTGQTNISVRNLGRGTLARIGTMIELTSKVIGRQHRRLQSLENLSAWQEAARRHAHEIRTPLTAARMELNQMAGLVRREAPDLSERVNQLTQSMEEELDHLKQFTQSFTSFAKVGKPKLQEVDPAQFLQRFADLFSEAWDNLTLTVELPEESTGLLLPMDKEMIRRVIMNLCNNSALAIQPEEGRVNLRLIAATNTIIFEVADDGPGIPEEIGSHLFEPYVTSRNIGEGMGLGLPIARKILLDHDGDLVLHNSSDHGAVFRLIFPRPKEHP